MRIEDPVGRGGSCIRSLNVVFDTGLVLLLSEPEVLLVLYTGIFKCATAGIRMQSLFYFLSVYWLIFFNFSFL